MALQKLSLANLENLDLGKVSAAFQKEVSVVVKDMMDRPGDASTRTVLLELQLAPTIDDTGDCEGARGEFTIKSKVPPRKSKPYTFNVRKDGALIFSEDSLDNPNQTTVFEADNSGRVRREQPD